MDMLTTIAALIRAGVSLRLNDDGELELLGDAEALPEELREALETHREALCECLSVSLSDIAFASTRFADAGLEECANYFDRPIANDSRIAKINETPPRDQRDGASDPPSFAKKGQ